MKLLVGIATRGPNAADLAPDLRLRTGMTARDRVKVNPHPGSFPWMDPGAGRFMERPAGYQAVPTGQAWEASPPQARAVPRRTANFLP